jgi:hypothetical protein
MTPIFTTAMVGVELSKPWSPTHMKSYAKGRAPHRIWVKMVSNREAERDRARRDRDERKKMNAVLRKFARATGLSMKAAKAYVIEHAAEIWE